MCLSLYPHVCKQTSPSISSAVFQEGLRHFTFDLITNKGEEFSAFYYKLQTDMSSPRNRANVKARFWWDYVRHLIVIFIICVPNDPKWSRQRSVIFKYADNMDLIWMDRE